MTDGNLLRWLAHAIYTAMSTPIEQEQRAEAVRNTVMEFVGRAESFNENEREMVLHALERWITLGQVDGFTLPSDKETFSWMEAMLGTLLGVVEI